MGGKICFVVLMLVLASGCGGLKTSDLAKNLEVPKESDYAEAKCNEENNIEKKVLTIPKTHFVGQKIKILPVVDSLHHCLELRSQGNRVIRDACRLFSGRDAVIVEHKKVEDLRGLQDVFTLEMTDDHTNIYLLLSNGKVPSYIGFYSLLESARAKYIGKEFLFRSGSRGKIEKRKVVGVKFASEKPNPYSSVIPYVIDYMVDDIVKSDNYFISETYFGSSISSMDWGNIFERNYFLEDEGSELSESYLREYKKENKQEEENERIKKYISKLKSSEKVWINAPVVEIRKDKKSGVLVTTVSQGQELFVQKRVGNWLEVIYVSDGRDLDSWRPEYNTRSLDDYKQFDDLGWIESKYASPVEVEEMSDLEWRRYWENKRNLKAENRRNEFISAHPNLSASHRAAISSGRTVFGMTKNMVRASVGSPNDINITSGSWGTNEQWVYDNKYLYFKNGVLESMQY